MKKIAFLCYLVFSLHCLDCHSQRRQFKFTRINQLNDASIGQVNAIAEDKNGFIWLSEESNGALIRFDGDNVKRYYNNPREKNSLGGTSPECLLVDREGFLWIGFYGQGLDRFDPVTESFKHFRYDPGNAKGISSDTVTSILQDRNGTIYVGTYGGLNILDTATGNFRHYQHIPGDSKSLSSDFVRVLYEDSQGTLWVGTGWLDVKDEGGLNRFNNESGTFTRYMADPKNPEALIHKRITSLFEDSRGTFWVGTGDDVLHSMERTKGTFTRHLYDPGNPNKLSAPSMNAKSFGVNFIAEDIDHNLWIGGAGVNVYDAKSDTIIHFGDNTDFFGTFIESNTWRIHMADNGLIWLTTQPGVYIVDPFSYQIPRIEERMPAFFRESDSVVWSGSTTGLVKENYSTGTKVRWSFDPSDPNSISNDTILVISMDRKGILWIGTPSGLNRFDPNLEQFTRYRNDPSDSSSISNDFIDVIFTDEESIWLGTQAGLSKMNRNTERFSTVWLGGATLELSGILEGAKHELWIGHLGGIVKWNKETGEAKGYPIGNGINQVYKDSYGSIWLATQNGIYRYNEEEDRFALLSNYPMISIIEDHKKNLWVRSISQLFKITEHRDNIIQYSSDQVVRIRNLMSFHAGGFLASNGNIYLGDENDYFLFNPDSLLVPPDSSKLYFTDFWLKEDLQVPSQEGRIKSSLLNTNPMSLNYEQNVFAISFTELDYRDNKRNKIQYLLEGYDLGWRESFSEERITYYNVPSGEYLFKVRAQNSSTGEWAENSIGIIITPPWWQRFWAYAVFSVSLISLVWGIIQYRSRALKESNRLLEQKVAQRTKDLEHSIRDLRETQAQLIQSEKMASLGELTAGIAHEIQNPLNFVNNFTEVSNELLEEMTNEMGKGNLEDARNIASGVKQNLEKVLQHGKRADAIVKGMLQHSGNRSGTKEPTDINALADEYLRLAYHGLRAKDKSFNATMNTSFDNSIGKINVIPQDVGRVILNIIANAFYAVTERKKQDDVSYEPTVSVSTRKIANKVEIIVKDNGNGIPKRVLDKIFQPFFTTKPAGQGTGLGLSISYDIIKAHGGELKVETNEGEGSAFIIQIPIV